MQAKVKIIFYPGDGTVQTYGLNTANNVSNSARLGTSAGYKGFYLGGENTPGSSLDTKRFFGTEGYPGLNSSSMWNGTRWVDTSTGAEAEAPKLAIAVEGNDLKYMTLRFDELLTEYPPEIKCLRLLPAGDSGTVTETTVSLDGPVAVIQLDLTPGNYILTLQSWSQENACAKITDLQIGHTAVLGPDKVFKLTASKENRAQVKKFEQGLSSQYADITFFNNRKEFAQLADLGLLQENLRCEVWLDDVKVEEYLTAEYDIPGTEPQAVVKCEDTLRRLHNTQYYGFDLKTYVTMDAVLLDVLQGTGLSVEYMDANSETLVKETRLLQCYADTDTTFNTLQKICAAVGCRMWCAENKLRVSVIS